MAFPSEGRPEPGGNGRGVWSDPGLWVSGDGRGWGRGEGGGEVKG